MNITEKSSDDPVQEDQFYKSKNLDVIELTEPRIGGYDAGTKPVLKEPSLYLSIAVVFIATFVCLGKTPVFFWASFITLSALAVAFHVLAERHLFRANREFEAFSAPFEGVFVITFGSILPGIALLAYGIFSLATEPNPNFLNEIGKLALLLVVPLFNFSVWSAVRKGYLIRPRLVGLMNGLALGLSVSWTMIWLKSLFFSTGDPSCKFGWMLLLCTSPFLLFAAACLNYDLWRKTESSIGRITTTFSIMGSLLSMLFVFTPMARALFVQSLVTDAKQGSIEKRACAVATLQTVATDEDLRPALHPVSGFALAELLVPNRGLNRGNEVDENAYFKITGKPYAVEVEKRDDAHVEQSPVVGSKIPGLTLAKSQITGSIDATSLSSSIDWKLTLHNSNWDVKEARGEISLPKGAVVSRATLWINGQPREAAFASKAKTQAAYEAIVNRQRDPLLVTMSATDRVLVRCSPVPANGGDMKIRIGFKVPLETTDGKTCSLELPRLLSTNFTQPKRHRITLMSKDKPVKTIDGIVATNNAEGYALNGILKTVDQNKKIVPVVTQRANATSEIAVQDWYSRERRFIVQQLKEVTQPAPKKLLVVLDPSETLKSECAQIKNALASIPAAFKPAVYLAAPSDSDKVGETASIAMNVGQAQAAINPELFLGGHDNGGTLREVLETAAEQPDSAVLWIHGPQPVVQHRSESSALDLVHGVRLYDLQIGEGPNTILKSLRLEDVSNLMTLETLKHQSVSGELKALLSEWEKGTRKLVVQRTLSTNPQKNMIADPSVSAQVTCLWAKEEVERLSTVGRDKDAVDMSSKYRIVSEDTGAVVLENAKDYAAHGLDPGAYDQQSSYRGPGLVGAPVDPRYGQSNEVGRLADFSYDTARDISRAATMIALLVSIVIAILMLRATKELTGRRVANAIILVIGAPIAVHLMGTFMINNYGGLGGGL